MQPSMLSSRKNKVIAVWCGILMLVLCVHFLVSYQGVELPGIGRNLYAGDYQPPPYYKVGNDKKGGPPTTTHPETVRYTPVDRKKLYNPPEGETKQRRFPKAVIVGTGKCGTRALINYISMHPYVVRANNEIHFFNRDENWRLGWDWYLSQMPLSYSNQMTIEKSPSYVEHPRTPAALFGLDKKMRFLWVVRDPVVRLMSVMALHHENSNDRPSYLTVTQEGKPAVRKNYEPLWRGEYVIFLRRWLRYFPLSQIHVLDGDNLRKDPIKEMQEIEAFLKLPKLLGPRNFYYNASKGFYCGVRFADTVPRCLGSSKGREHPVLNETIKTLLYDFFRPYNEQFFKLLGKRFDWEPKEKV